MSLTIGIIAKDGVVIASDSRMSNDLFLNDNVEKIINLSPHIVVGLAGDGMLASHIFDIIKKENLLTKIDSGIQSLAEELRDILAQTYQKYFPEVAYEDRTRIKILLAGYTTEEPKEPHLYVLSSRDNFVPRQSPAGHNSIGVTEISQYILNRIYEPGKMKTTQAAKLSVFCLKETHHQTKSVGGKFKVGTFSDTHAFKLLPENEIGKLVKSCVRMQDSHKGKFYPEDTDGSDL